MKVCCYFNLVIYSHNSKVNSLKKMIVLKCRYHTIPYIMRADGRNQLIADHATSQVFGFQIRVHWKYILKIIKNATGICFVFQFSFFAMLQASSVFQTTFRLPGNCLAILNTVAQIFSKF